MNLEVLVWLWAQLDKTYLPPICARVEMRHLLSRSFHEAQLSDASMKWAEEAKTQGTLNVSEIELSLTTTFCFSAVADLRNSTESDRKGDWFAFHPLVGKVLHHRDSRMCQAW